MAFNPFTSFRRYQKAIFATMAIVCMLLFVVSSGGAGADLLNQFTDWFSRGRGGSGDAAASIDGRKIGQEDVANVIQQRKLASTYMESVTELAHQQAFSSIYRQRDDANPELQRVITEYAQLEVLKRQLPPEYILNGLARLAQQLRQVRLTLSIGDTPNKQKQTALVDSLQVLVDRDINRITRAYYQPRDGFFGGNLDKTDEALDFMLWKDQADKLGIHMMKEDVGNAIAAETMNQKLTPDTQKALDQGLRQKFRGYSVKALHQALAEEFRVRAAKHALMGGGIAAAAPAATPDEMFNWYKDVRTDVRAGLIEVPVSKFVDKVTEQPTDAQLRELFDKRRNEEFDPRLEYPGFKEPRKVKVDWLALPSDAPFYVKATALAPVFSALSQFGSVAISGDGTAGLPLSLLLAARQAIPDLPMEQLYREYVQNEASWTSPIAFGPRSGVHDSSVARPINIAAMIGAGVAGGLTKAGPLAAPLALEGRAIVTENIDRARIGATAILSAATDPAPLAIDALLSALIPPAPKEEALRGILAQRYRERMTDGLAKADRDWFVTEVSKRSKEQNRVNVEAFVNDFIHTRQLRRGGMAEPNDRHSLSDDPGLAELRSAFEKMYRTKDPTGEQFASRLVDGMGQEKPQLFHMMMVDGAPVSYLHWRTEDREPRSVSFEQAKPNVEAAWKYDKARPLAKAEAERLATEAKNKTEMELRDLAAKNSPRGLIELPPMARLNPSRSFGSGGSPRYDPPAIPQDKIKYSGTLVNSIIDLRKENAGATTVAPDFARNNYYVAALMSKEEPTADAFRIAYKGSMGPTNFRDNLFDYFRNDRAIKYRDDLTKQLRTDARLEVFKPDKKATDEES